MPLFPLSSFGEREWIGGLASASQNNWKIQWGFVVQWLRHLPRQQETLGSNPGESPTFFTCQKAQESSLYGPIPQCGDLKGHSYQ